MHNETQPFRTAAYQSRAAAIEDPVRRLAYWINARSAIDHNRTSGHPKPWTQDPILQQFKFCNVHRERDRVTIWIKDNWRQPHYDSPHVWFAMCVARLINWPDTLEAIGYPLPWSPERVALRMHARMTAKQQVFTGAYLITSGGQKMSKIDYVVQALSKVRELHSYPDTYPRKGDTLAAAYTKLLAAPAFGGFMAAQVVADLKHTAILADAPDWSDWAAPGPGSLRGLNRIRGEVIRNGDRFIESLKSLREELKPNLRSHVGDLCLQDLQNCLCEFDKFERTLWGEGRPRSRYPGTI